MDPDPVPGGPRKQCGSGTLDKTKNNPFTPPSITAPPPLPSRFPGQIDYYCVPIQENPEMCTYGTYISIFLYIDSTVMIFLLYPDFHPHSIPNFSSLLVIRSLTFED
jgi:hypothetical protein